MNESAKNLPLLTIITPTLNNAHEIENFINSIRRQSYPQSKIEILFVDGGSKDKTREIAQKHHIKVIHNSAVLAEPGVTLGMENAQGELMMVLATDNIYHDPDAIKKIVHVFENDDVYAALPKQDYDETDNFLTKYHNTFTDPFNHFVYGYASNMRTFNKMFPTLIHNDIYDVYDFTKKIELPMMSFSQGFTIRQDYKRDAKDYLDDCTPIIDLIQRKKLIACVYSVSIYHHTIKDVSHFIKKQRWATQNALEKKKYGIAYRYSKLSSSQRLRTKLWPVYALSIFLPVIHAIYRLLKKENKMWIYHPIECFLCAYANGIQLFAFILGKIRNNKVTISRQ